MGQKPKPPASLTPAGDQPSFFDERPIALDGFRLTARSVEVLGRPGLDKWTRAFAFASAVEESSPYWIGELWNYAEQRPEWRERLPQALADAGVKLAMSTIYNHGYTVRNTTPEVRAASPSFSHTVEVAGLDPDDQQELIEEAATRGWSKRELRLNVKRKMRPKIIEGQAVLEGRFRVVYSDNPWKYGDRQPSGSGAEDHYPGMTIEEMCALPIVDHVTDDAVLYLWVPAPFMLLNPGPREVIEAWGFVYKGNVIWDKVDHNFGHYYSVRHEHLVIATRGSCLPDRPEEVSAFDSVQTIRRSNIHSAKPEDFRRQIEKLHDGPYLELFGRRLVDGWTVYGNDARLFTPAGDEAHGATA